jgi:hypothetical protein
VDNPNSNHQWTTGQKIAFRFFFVFLTLQVLTESFFGNLFGANRDIWTLGETIFVPPCLWLNKHFFHLKYNSQGWTTFSAVLHTIRDTVYLLLSILACVLWTIFDRKRSDYNKLLYWFSQALVMILCSIVFIYGIIKAIPVQMSFPSFISLQTPVGEMSPFDLIWITFGYGTPYQVFGGILEVLAAILILFRRTRIVGLVILIPLMVNIIMLNYTYQIGVLTLSFYILLVALFLLAPYIPQIIRFFFVQQPVILAHHEYVPGRNYKTIVLKTIGILFIGTSFILNLQSSYDRYMRVADTNRSRQYSLVKNYVINNDTLKLIENDTLCWRIWSERVTNGKNMVTITTMKPGFSKTYVIERDSTKQMLTLHPFNQPDSTPLNFNYTAISKAHWRLDGVIQKNNIQVDLQKINPDTVMTLLKTKRNIIALDDDTDAQ